MLSFNFLRSFWTEGGRARNKFFIFNECLCCADHLATRRNGFHAHKKAQMPNSNGLFTLHINRSLGAIGFPITERPVPPVCRFLSLALFPCCVKAQPCSGPGMH